MQHRGLTSLVSSDNVETDQYVSVDVVTNVAQAGHEGDWTDDMNMIKSQENSSVLPPRDASEIDVLAPELQPSFNLAAYVNK